MLKNLTLLISFILFNCSIVFGQEEIQRIKVDDNGKTINLYDYSIINLYDLGMALIKNNKIIFYDTTLKQTKIIDDRRIFKSTAVMRFFNELELETFFYDSTLKKIVISDGFILRLIDVVTHNIETVKLVFPKGADGYMLPYIISLGKNKFGSIEKGGNTILSKLDLETGVLTPVNLPNEWGRRRVKKMVGINKAIMAISYTDKNSPKDKFGNIAIFDEDGFVVNEKLLISDNVIEIYDFNISSKNSDTIFITGSYNSNSLPSYSNGIFNAQVYNFKSSKISSYSTKMFYMTSVDTTRLNKRQLKRLHKFPFGGINIMHPLYSVSNKNYMVSEVYKKCTYIPVMGGVADEEFIGYSVYDLYIVALDSVFELIEYKKINNYNMNERGKYNLNTQIRIDTKNEKFSINYFANNTSKYWYKSYYFALKEDYTERINNVYLIKYRLTE